MFNELTPKISLPFITIPSNLCDGFSSLTPHQLYDINTIAVKSNALDTSVSELKCFTQCLISSVHEQ